jgi:hypothetical protein
MNVRSVYLVAPAVAVLAVASALPARADTERYAVIIGHNTGAAEEQTLRYAESDAQRFADLFGDIGGVRSENQVVLRGKTADQVRSAMIATNERIRTGSRSGTDSVLFVYYSGHGDADALHLGDTRLPLRELEALVRGSPAAIRVLVIDACRSGSITRVKGGRPAPPLALATASPLLGEGTIVLTASTLSEDAQESDQLGGSFFTHYLISGLRGAADANGDHIITVGEAFSYTRDQTIVASSRTLAGTQHPTFHYDLRGRDDLPLADLGATAGHGTLSLPIGATWLILRTGSSRTVVGEIAAEAQRRTLSLRPGTYTVRGRTRDALLEGTATVAVGRDTAVDASTLERTMYAPLVRKGKGEFLSGVSGPFGGLSLPTSLLFGHLTGLAGAVVGWTWVRPNLTLSPRISAYRASGNGLYMLDVRVTRAWEVGRSSFDLGLATGGAYTYRDSGYEGIAAHLDVTLGANLPIWSRTYLASEIAAQAVVDFKRSHLEPGTLLTMNLLFGVWL